jgi:hypothetical protein
MNRKIEKFLPNSEIAHEASQKAEFMKGGNLPNITLADVLFRRDKRPANKQIDDIMSEYEDSDGIDFQSDLIQIGDKVNFR